MEVFQDYASYYNAFYRDKDYRKEAGQIDTLLKTYGKNINKIINYGCGTGKHDIALSDLGYYCTGIDLSSVMIKMAQENSRGLKENINFMVADIRHYEPMEKYDSVISLFHVMSYQNSNDDILATFQSARKALDKGGVFLFDTWYGPGVLSDKPCVRVKEVEEGQNRLIRIARPILYDKQNVVDVCYEVFVINKESGQTKIINEIHHMRYFFRPEIDYFLKNSGFELIENLDCVTLGETGYSSWTCYFVARAV